jgi:hypothetical protein
MQLKCPTCSSNYCIASPNQVITASNTLYQKCDKCINLILNKTATLDLSKVNYNDLYCDKCGKRPLDAVMSHILALSCKDPKRPDITLQEVGTPLLCPGVCTYSVPVLGRRNLIVLTTQQQIANAAHRIVDEVAEVKAVIKREDKRIIGLVDADTPPYTCDLIAGCDMRADLITSAYGQLLIYKSQSKVHIEHDNAIKMLKLGSLPIEDSVVLDGLSGPGTLGLMTVFMGASKVILNDAWLPFIKNAYLNLHVNKNILGIKSVTKANLEGLQQVATTPNLISKAVTKECEIELYHGDLRKFEEIPSKADIVLIDAFPGNEYRWISMIEKLKRATKGDVYLI